MAMMNETSVARGSCARAGCMVLRGRKRFNLNLCLPKFNFVGFRRSKKESIKRVNQWLDQNFQESGENPGSLTPLERQENSGNNA